ncbi:MAG: ABC transporter ATP-binding protein [Pyrinomonadaceae bacterium]
MTEQSPAALELSGVTYIYPKSQSGINDVSVSVPSGGIYGLLGVNGAGKTTLMRVLIGLLRPQKGSIRYFGSDLNTERRKKLSAVGSLIEVPSVYHHLTGRQHLRIFAGYTSSPSSAVDAVLDLVGIKDVGDRLVGKYSLGMKQRLALATALLHDPAILVLDEPTNGLDPVGIPQMRDLLRYLTTERGKTIVVSSHLLAEVQKMATHVGIIHKGKFRFQGSISELTIAASVRGGGKALRLRVSSPASAINVLMKFKSIETLEPDVIKIPVFDEAEAANVIRRLVDANVEVYEVNREENSLEQGFLNFLEESQNAG